MVVTSYEILLADIKAMAKYHWKYIVVDEVTGAGGTGAVQQYRGQYISVWQVGRMGGVGASMACTWHVLSGELVTAGWLAGSPSGLRSCSLFPRPCCLPQGHRLKNMNCKLIRELKTLHTENKLLLTGACLVH